MTKNEEQKTKKKASIYLIHELTLFFFYFICHSKSKRKLLDLVMLAYISEKDISSVMIYLIIFKLPVGSECQ